MNRRKITMRIVAIIMAMVFSMQCFAAVVSDNDGPAFITKAEFEVLKKDFEMQVERYNESIDKKIDGAIAAYLAGIKLVKTYDWELDTKSTFIGKVTWGDVAFSSLIGEKALTVPNKNFLVGQDETYCGITWDTSLNGTSTKISEGGFDLSYKPEYVMGYMQEYGEDKQLYMDSWGLWKPYFYCTVSAFFKSAHSSDDSGGNPEWYGFMKETRSTSATSFTGNEWVVKPKKNSDSVTRWTMASSSNNKWERGNYCDEFEDKKQDLVLYPLSEQENKLRNYKESKRMLLRDGFSHKLTDVYRSGTQNFIQSYPWTSDSTSFTNLDLGNSEPPAKTMTPYLNRLASDPSSVKEDKYKYSWLKLTYKNWTKSMMTSSWPSWVWHGGPYTYMGWVSVNTSGNENFSSIQSKKIKFKSPYLSKLAQVNEGLVVWNNDQTNGKLKISLSMSEDGHAIFYVGKKPDVTWGGTSNKLGGREKDYEESESWTTNQLWKNNDKNIVEKNKITDFTIDNMSKNDALFFIFLPNDSTKTAKINSLKLVLESD